MDILDVLKKIIADIMDIDEQEIDRETYLIRDLNMESIDLLELSVAINSQFKIDVEDDKAFLKDLRFILKEIDHNTSLDNYLSNQYPHLSKSRIDEILADLENGPVLKLKDVEQYINYTLHSHG